MLHCRKSCVVSLELHWEVGFEERGILEVSITAFRVRDGERGWWWGWLGLGDSVAECDMVFIL